MIAIKRPACLAGAVALLALLILPLLVTAPYPRHVLILTLMYANLAATWNLIAGYTGLKTFGHHAFFGIGAYVSALLSLHLGMSPWLSIWIGGAVAAVAGCVIGMPILRLRSAPHVAIVTLSFAEILRILISNLQKWTRGELGLWGIPAFSPIHMPVIGTVKFTIIDRVPDYYLILGLFLLTMAAIIVTTRSRIGLALVAIREAERAAESLGINLTRYKLGVFTLSAFLVALSGAFYAHYLGILTPSAVIGPDVMILIIAMTLLGGIGTFSGPIVGAFLLTLGREALRPIGDYDFAIMGALIVIVVVLMPQGMTRALHPLRLVLQQWRARPLSSGKGNHPVS